MTTPLDPYDRFLRNFLVTHAYMEYHKVSAQEKSAIKDSDTLCETIFQSLYPILTYYLERLNGEYSQIAFDKEIQVFPMMTFQQYIDETINIKTIGTYDYQRFTENMKDEGFRTNLYRKFEKSMAMRRLKNHLFFILELHDQRDRNKEAYRTPTESEYIDTVLDATVYFDYLARRETTDSEKENQALALIDRMLFV
jgi:hypothetical protein